MEASQYPKGDFREPLPLIGPGYTSRRITDKLASVVMTKSTPFTWFIFFGVGFVLLNILTISVVYLFAKGDQVSVNPGTSALLRPGNLADRTLYYRHDLAFEQDPSIPTNPHVFAGLALFPNSLVSSIARGAQEMIAVLFASDGETVIHPEPGQFFEVPIVGPLPETLNFIP